MTVALEAEKVESFSVYEVEVEVAKVFEMSFEVAEVAKIHPPDCYYHPHSAVEEQSAMATLPEA